MTKFLDLFAILIVALLLLLPQPSVDVFPAVQGDKADLDRLAAGHGDSLASRLVDKTDLDRLAVLEDVRYRAPDDANAAVDLARAYLRIDQPAWAVATLQPFMSRGEYQVHQVAAYAYATLLLPQEALKQAEQGLSACNARGAMCPDVARIRLEYLADLMRQPSEAGVKPALDPLRARQMVQQALRATKAGMKPAPAQSPEAPAAQPQAPQKTPAPTPTGNTLPQ